MKHYKFYVLYYLPQKIIVHNVPDIIDVNKLISLIKNFGVKVENIDKGSYSFVADNVNFDYLKSNQFKVDGKGLRGSIMLVGPYSLVLEKEVFHAPVETKLEEEDLTLISRIYRVRCKIQL